MGNGGYGKINGEYLKAEGEYCMAEGEYLKAEGEYLKAEGEYCRFFEGKMGGDDTLGEKNLSTRLIRTSPPDPLS